jgi:hypothetical protein
MSWLGYIPALCWGTFVLRSRGIAVFFGVCKCACYRISLYSTNSRPIVKCKSGIMELNMVWDTCAPRYQAKQVSLGSSWKRETVAVSLRENVRPITGQQERGTYSHTISPFSLTSTGCKACLVGLVSLSAGISNHIQLQDPIFLSKGKSWVEFSSHPWYSVVCTLCAHSKHGWYSSRDITVH